MAIMDWSFGPSSTLDREFDRLRRQVDEVFGRFNMGAGPGMGFPAMNIYEEDENVVVVVQAPGLTQENLNVEARENILTITGKRDAANMGEADILRMERFNGEFRRTLRIPYKVQNDRIEASIKDGLLMLRMPKTEEAKPKRIAINA